MGKYGLLGRAEAASTAPGAPDIGTAPVKELETIPGVGPKTARFFIVHSREGARVAVIDTHVLKFLRDMGHAVPAGFPSRKDYARLEGIMLKEMAARGLVRPSTAEPETRSEVERRESQCREVLATILAREDQPVMRP